MKSVPAIRASRLLFAPPSLRYAQFPVVNPNIRIPKSNGHPVLISLKRSAS